MIMHEFRSTPRLATPGILINQQVVPRDWSSLRRAFNDPPSIDRDAAGVRSPLVIKETIESLEQALLERGDTPLDFMVLATALRYQFADRHMRLLCDGNRQVDIVHCVEGQWATAVSVNDGTERLDSPDPHNPQADASLNAGRGLSSQKSTKSGPRLREQTTQLTPRSVGFAFQALCGCRVGVDLVDPENGLASPE